jgi:shikimate kinase
MTKIPLITVVANYFSCKDSNEFKFSTLNKIKNAVESHFLKEHNTFVYVDTSWDEISSVIETYPNYFQYNQNYTSIIFNEKIDLYSIFNKISNSDVETSQRKIITFLENYIENDLVE